MLVNFRQSLHPSDPKLLPVRPVPVFKSEYFDTLVNPSILRCFICRFLELRDCAYAIGLKSP
jgi:hypothetical protein